MQTYHATKWGIFNRHFWGDPALTAIRKIQARRNATWLDRVLAQLDTWLPIVRRMRPAQPWGDVARVLN